MVPTVAGSEKCPIGIGIEVAMTSNSMPHGAQNSLEFHYQIAKAVMKIAQLQVEVSIQTGAATAEIKVAMDALIDAYINVNDIAIKVASEQRGQ
jgi:hypothetical protein